jgi:hypothetical protein
LPDDASAPEEAPDGDLATASDGRIALLDQQLAAFERAAAEAGEDHITVDTSGPAADTVREALAKIYRACLRRRPGRPLSR